ncbi:hypothetical protein BJX70DRAFT_248937 [Aspergillus crustosus]
MGVPINKATSNRVKDIPIRVPMTPLCGERRTRTGADNETSDPEKIHTMHRMSAKTPVTGHLADIKQEHRRLWSTEREYSMGLILWTPADSSSQQSPPSPTCNRPSSWKLDLPPEMSHRVMDQPSRLGKSLTMAWLRGCKE